MNPPNSNPGRGFSSSSGGSSWPQSSSWRTGSSISRTVEIHVPQISHTLLRRRVHHPELFMQETDENDQVSRGLSQEYPGESETTTNEQLEEHQFQQEPMNQMDERQMEMEMQYSQAEAEAQAEAQTSYHQTPHDQYMASRQLHIEQLTQNERQIQEQWVHAQLYLCGGCVAGFAWYQNGAGYRCMGDNHYVTDALLAEGMGGWYTREIDAYTPREVWAGPFYALEQQDQGIYELDKPQLVKQNRRSKRTSWFPRRPRR